MIEMIFFDMDGVLVLSEPYWRQAEAELFFDLFGIKLSEEDVHHTTGLKTTEVVQYHKTRYKLDADNEIVGHEIEKRVIELVREFAKPMPGLINFTDWVTKQNIRRCLVTSSSRYVIENILEHVGLVDFFEKKFTAYDEEWGKPNPAVYNSAVSYSELSKDKIIVIEDSMNGVKAAYQAGLTILGLPDEHNKTNLEYLSYIYQAFDDHVQLHEYFKRLQ
jgi:HAD superfamily hydrolase (TIGR01509 family)